MRFKEILSLGGLPIFIASLCCLTPIILVLFGISSIAFAASLTNVLDGQYRWAFILAGILTLIISLIIYYRRKGICTIDQAVKHKNEIINKTILILIVTGVGYFIFFDVFLNYVGKILQIWQ